jgi:DNA-binding winged helix-turn-helix (wHTH) protein
VLLKSSFGEFVLDSGTRLLTRGAVSVPLTPKAYLLLELLLARRPNAVSRTEIHDCLWPAIFVTDVNVSTLVFELRAALGDDARRPRYVRTIRKFGFAFAAETLEEQRPGDSTPAPFIDHRLLWADREVALKQGQNVLGRCAEAAAWIESARVSRRHARISISGDRAVLEDLGSKNGTYLEGERLDGPRVLKDRDRIGVGSVEVVFRALLRSDSTETARSRSRPRTRR